MPAPAPQPDPNDPIVLDKFAGLRNTISPERLAPGELSVATNVDLDDASQAHRRRGRQKVADGDFHSVWTDDRSVVYGVKDGTLGIIDGQNQHQSLSVAVGTSPVAYVDIAGTIYFSSASIAGKIVDGVAVPWGGDDIWQSPVVNPTETLPAIRGKLLGRPPLATCLASFNGRIYLGSGRTVWATELYNYDFIDKTKNYWQFEGEITMIGAVSDGLYVGTDEGVYFVGGTLAKPQRKRVLDSPAIPGSLVYMPVEVGNPLLLQRNPDQNTTVSVAFLTNAGHCLGTDGGNCFNITEDRFVFPGITRAAGLFRRQNGVNQYLASATTSAWAINTRTGAVTQYTNFTFNSMTKRSDDVFLGASSDGLFVLDGDADDTAPITTLMRGGFMQPGGSHFTSFKAVYLGMRATTNAPRTAPDFIFKFLAGDGREYAYGVKPLNMQTTRIMLGKGLRSRYFQWEFQTLGPAFDLDSIEFVPLVSTRRI